MLRKPAPLCPHPALQKKTQQWIIIIIIIIIIIVIIILLLLEFNPNSKTWQ